MSENYDSKMSSADRICTDSYETLHPSLKFQWMVTDMCPYEDEDRYMMWMFINPVLNKVDVFFFILVHWYVAHWAKYLKRYRWVVTTDLDICFLIAAVGDSATELWKKHSIVGRLEWSPVTLLPFSSWLNKTCDRGNENVVVVVVLHLPGVLVYILICATSHR